MKRTIRPRRTSRFELQQLEDRTTPADFTLGGLNTLNITLNVPGETISLNATALGFHVEGSVAATASGGAVAGVAIAGNAADVTVATMPINTVNIFDTAAGTTVRFVHSGSQDYTPAFGVNLAMGGGSTIDFVGRSHFAGTSFAGSADSVTSPWGLGSSLSASNNINLTATVNNVTLPEAVASTAGGNITIAAPASFIDQNMSSTTGIATSGNVSFTAGWQVNLTNANFVGGTVTFNEAVPGTLTGIGWRNKVSSAILPNIAGLTALNDYSLSHDNAAVTLPALTVGNSLNVTAFGDIKATGTLTGAGGTFTVLGNSTIDLDDATNYFASVSFYSSRSTKSVFYKDNDDISLGYCDLGRASLWVLSQTGNISQFAPIVQLPGAGDVTLKVGNPATIDVSTQDNLFGGNIKFDGSPNSVLVKDASPLASFDRYTFLGAPNSLTVRQPTAPVVLDQSKIPGSVASLTVESLGIYQKPGVAGVVVANADFDSLQGEIILTNVNNDFGTLSVTNTSRNNVSIVDANGLLLGSVDVAAARLSVEAKLGTLSQSGISSITTASDSIASFKSTGGDLTLGILGNNFGGRVDLTSDSNVSVFGGNLQLGNVTTQATKSLTISGGGMLTQAIGTRVSAGGTTTINSFGNVALNNPTNTFVGMLAANIGFGSNQSFRATGPVSLGNVLANGFTLTTTGAITQAGGGIINAANATFDAGTADITLGNGNDFGTFAATTRGALTVNDTSALTLGNLDLGIKAVSIAASGPLSQAFDTLILQDLTLTGTVGTFTVDTSGSSVSLDNSGNEIRSAFKFGSVGDVSLKNRLDVSIDLTSTPFSATANLDFVAGGDVVLTGTTLNVADAQFSGSSIKVNKDVTATNSLLFRGWTDFSFSLADIKLTAGTEVKFDGDVSLYGTGGTLQFDTPSVKFVRGTWDQGSRDLTMLAPNSTFEIGDTFWAPPAALFMMTDGDVTLGGGTSTLTVHTAGSFAIGDDPMTAENVKVSGGNVLMGDKAKFSVGMNPTNAALSDYLDLNGGTLDVLNPWDKPMFIAEGLADGVGAQVVRNGTVAAGFEFQRASRTTPAPFYAGTDIVQATYNPGNITIAKAGTEDADGIVTGWLSDGDAYKVTTSLGAAGKLVVIERTEFGLEGLDIVVRNNAGAATLTVANLPIGGSGDDVIPIFGIGVINFNPAAGTATINAASSDLRQAVVTAHTHLASLTVRDIGPLGAEPVRIATESTSAQATSITARDIRGLTFLSEGSLSSLKARQINEMGAQNEFYASSFGTISTTGSVTEKVAGDFQGDIIQVPLYPTPLPMGTRLTSLTVAGELYDSNIDLQGDIGTIDAARTSDTQIGRTLTGSLGGARAVNPDGLRNVTTLDLGHVATTDVNASGALSAVKATEWTFGTIRAKNIVSLTTTVDTVARTQGDVQADIVVTGNAGGTTKTALGTLAIAGDYAQDPFTGQGIVVRNGNVGTVSVGRVLSDKLTVKTTPEGGGSVTSITAASISSFDLDARNSGAVKALGNLSYGIFGDIVSSDFTLRGNNGAAGVALADLYAARNIGTTDVVLMAGKLTSLSAPRTVSDTSVTAYDPNLGDVGSVTIGRWSSGSIYARTLGAFAANGSAAALADTSLMIGNVSDMTISAFLDDPTKTTLGIASFKAAANIDAVKIFAYNGLGSFNVGRDVSDTVVVADAVDAGNATRGRIGSIIAGNVLDSGFDADSIGNVSVNGYLTPDRSKWSRTDGRMYYTSLLAKNASPLTGVALGTVTTDAEMDHLAIFAPRGVAGIKAGSSIMDSIFDVDYVPDGGAVLAGYGKISSLAAAAVLSSEIAANTIGTITTTPSARFGQDGSIANWTRITARDASAATGIGAVSISGDFEGDCMLLAPAKVTSITVGGTVMASTIAAGFGATGSLGSAKFGELHAATLVSRQIPTVQIVGNVARGLAGGIGMSFINVWGNVANVGIGSFTVRGTLEFARIDVTDGDLTNFTAARLRDSTVQVGAQFTKGNTVDSAVVFGPTVRKIGSFTTTAPYSGNASPMQDQIDSASFRDSYIVAASLGTVTLSGQVSTWTEKHGVVFKTGSPSGTVKVAGTTVADNTAYLGTTRFWKKGNP